MGLEPHSVVSSALKPASLTPAEGVSPLARSPRKGLTPFGIPTAVGSILFYPAPHVSRITIHVFLWSGRWDLNPRQPAWKAGTLPLSYARPSLSAECAVLSSKSDSSFAQRSALRTCLHPALVGRQGFEPWKPMATDLQSAPFGHLGTCPKHLAHCATKKSESPNDCFPHSS